MPDWTPLSETAMVTAMTTTHTPKWSSNGNGSWSTQDGRWTASARWNKIQGNHWSLQVGDWQGPIIVSRDTLREIKAIVADAETIALYVRSERGILDRAVARYQAMLDEAETNARPGQGHIVQSRLVQRNNAQRNLDRFDRALAAQASR